jgi:hypothetical protein
MLRSAAEALSSAGGDGERVIVYLGDGAATAGPLAPDELLRELDAPLRGVRVQAVALGARSDDLVLEALSQKTGGDLVRADAKDDLRALVRELRIRAKVPVAQGLTLELPDGMIYTHASHTALRPGDTLVLVGQARPPRRRPLKGSRPRRRRPRAQRLVRGQARGGPFGHPRPPRPPAAHVGPRGDRRAHRQ